MTDPKIREEALRFMQRNKIGVVTTISTISGSSEPQAATVICLVDDSFNIYFATMTLLRKFKNIEKNNNIGIVIGTDHNFPLCVQAQGKAEIIKDPKDVMIDFFQKHINLLEGLPTPEWMPLIKMKETEMAVVKIKPYWLRWMNLDVKNAGKEMFYQIIPS